MSDRQHNQNRHDQGIQSDPSPDGAAVGARRLAIAGFLHDALPHLRKAAELASMGEYPEASMFLGSPQFFAESAVSAAERALEALRDHPLPTIAT